MSCNRKYPRGKKIIKLAVLAAAIMCLLSVTAYAAGSIINSPAAAEKVARQELAAMQELGILSESVEALGEPVYISELKEREGDDYWFGRIFPHRYVVRWYGEGKYLIDVHVNTADGKITKLSIEAAADEDDVPIRSKEEEVPAGPDPSITEMVTWYYYDNYGDIFPEDITVDEFCTLLAKYWGFEGYRLADTEDEFYGSFAAPAGDTLLRDIEKGDCYMTVFFEGDQDGAPMYVQVTEFPGRVALFVGTNHLVG